MATGTTATGAGVWRATPAGGLVDSRGAFLDMLGEAVGAGAEALVVPVERLSPRFFELSTGLAGEVAQAAVNYGRRLVILGDGSAVCERSRAFRDWVRECGRSRHIAFVPDEAGLSAALER